MKRFCAVNILLILFITMTAHAVLSADTNGKRLNLNLKEVPFPEVVRYIFAYSKDKYKYSVDPALNNLKVSAALKNVTRDQAIQVITKTAGIIYSVNNNTYKFKPDPHMVNVKTDTHQRPVSIATRKGPATIDLITLHYVNASDAALLLNASPPDGLENITTTSVNTLMLKGDASAIEQATKLIKLFDVESALPHSIRIVLSLKGSVAKSNEPIAFSTESVGPEGNLMPLNIDFKNTRSDNYMLDAKFVSTVLSDGSVSLTGSGLVQCCFSGTQRLSKTFEVAVPANPGTPVVIASGVAGSGEESIKFDISVTVTVEKGRIVMPKGIFSTPGNASARSSRNTSSSPVSVNKPDQSHINAADTLLQQIWKAEPGKPKFDAVDAVAGEYRKSDMATRNAISWLCVTYMKDKNRAILDRWPCCYVLSRCGNEQAIPDLVDVLSKDRVEIMRAVAAEALGEMSDNNSAAARDALVQAEKTETSKQVREVFARYLK